MPFPHSVVLVGMRQVRDYLLAAEDRQAVSWLGTTSPFNITAEAQTLAPFAAGEVAELLARHTAATGQRFEPAAVALVHGLSQGHPWLVNALADQMVRDVPDRGAALTAPHVERARETIILARRTQIDSLVARLREPRVRRIIASCGRWPRRSGRCARGGGLWGFEGRRARGRSQGGEGRRGCQCGMLDGRSSARYVRRARCEQGVHGACLG